MSSDLNIEETLRKRLQSILSDGLVIVVGSGLSSAEGLPGMAQLASRLDSVLPGKLSGDDKDQWEEISSKLKSQTLEIALQEVKSSENLEKEITSVVAELIAEREKIVIDEIFSNNRVLRFTRLVPHLLRSKEGVPVVTTNYDRLIEFAVEEAGLSFDNMFYGANIRRIDEKLSKMSFLIDVKILKGKTIRRIYRDKINIYKPHGSIDWYLRGGEPVQTADSVSLPRLMITPGANKFLSGYDIPFDRNREKANAAIDKASRFLIIGYGFNDDHLETHLVSRLKSGVPALLLTHSLTDNAQKIIAECQNLMALECADADDEVATRLLYDGTEYKFASARWWDLAGFVTELLEP